MNKKDKQTDIERKKTNTERKQKDIDKHRYVKRQAGKEIV